MYTSCCLSTFIIIIYYLRNKTKHVFLAFIACWKRRQMFRRILEHSYWSALELSKTLPRFSQGNGGIENMFCFFYKIIILRLKKGKGDIRRARIVLFLSSNCKLSQLGDSKTSFLCLIALWKHTCRPIRTHVVSELFYNWL